MHKTRRVEPQIGAVVVSAHATCCHRCHLAVATGFEPSLIAMLVRIHAKLLPLGATACFDSTTGVQSRVRELWPRLHAHLHAICTRPDLTKGRTAVLQGGRGPAAVLDALVKDEWLDHAFVGALSWGVLLWAWDQCALQGWEVLADLCIASLWLIRREVRRLDATGAGVAELRDAMLTRLQAVSLPEMQALLASIVAARGVEPPSSAQPQVMLRLPLEPPSTRAAAADRNARPQ